MLPNGCPRGFAFVDMSSSEGAEAVQTNCNGHIIDKQEIRVSYGMPCRPGACILQPRNNTPHMGSWNIKIMPVNAMVPPNYSGPHGPTNFSRHPEFSGPPNYPGPIEFQGPPNYSGPPDYPNFSGPPEYPNFSGPPEYPNFSGPPNISSYSVTVMPADSTVVCIRNSYTRCLLFLFLPAGVLCR